MQAKGGTMTRWPGRIISTAVWALLAALPLACGDGDDDGGAGADDVIVFNGEANRLNAYAARGIGDVYQTVIENSNLDPAGRDINGQICFTRGPNGEVRFIAGEDTGQNNGILQGWGFFELSGRRVGELSAVQIGKLTPTYQSAADNAENYGCGFLSDGRLLTTDVGNQASGPLDGQLIVWFPPFDQPSPRFCKIDIAIGTAQSIAIDGDDNVYVGSARGTAASPNGIFRFSGAFPTADDASGGCGRTDGTGAPLVDAGRVAKELFIRDARVPTSGGVVLIPGGGFYVSSVASGTIAEFDAAGVFQRMILAPPEGAPLFDFPGGTPLGIGLAPDGTLYYADIGLAVGNGSIGPGRNLGKVRRIRFVDGEPQAPELVDEGLNFPDGIGILALD